MRELVVEGQEVLIIPKDFKKVNKGIVKKVNAGDFELELKYEPDGILVNNYCEFYTQTKHGKLYFDSYPKNINGKTLLINSPAKHKFLQRRQYTRIKYNHDFEITSNQNICHIKTMDISAGGMKFVTSDIINIDAQYNISIPIYDKCVNCIFTPIRIEKNNEGVYTVSGQFSYESGHDKMLLTQYCAKRSVEINNK